MSPEHAHEPLRLSPPLAVGLGGAVALAVVAASEAARAPTGLSAVQLGLALEAAVLTLGWPIGAVTCAAVLVSGRGRWGRREALLVAAPLALVAAGHAHWVVGRYEAFRWYAPLLALFGVLALVLWAALVVLLRERGRRASLALTGVGLVGGVSALALNQRLYRGDYPTLHHGVLEAALLLLAVGLVAGAHALMSLRPDSAETARRRLALALAIALLALVGAGAVAATRAAAASPRERATFRRFSDLGRLTPTAPPPAAATPPAPAHPPAEPDAPAALEPSVHERFARHSGLPALPEGFRLDEHSVLLLSVETTRCRDTTLCTPSLRTTPRLAAHAARRGVVFTNAHSAAAGTLASMSSMLTMSYPSSLDLRLRDRWHGALSEGETTVVEALGGQGYRTFFAGHDYKGHFTRGSIGGLHQGFAERRHAPGGHSRLHDPDIDQHVRRLALGALRRHHASGERFFGWVFFESPHEPYLARPPLSEDSWPHQRYRAEIRNADRHLGAVLDLIEELGMFEDTVVIVHGDHGEAFGEHDRGGHADVYSEITHVPLWISVPGLEAARRAAPTSLVHVFPWLLASAEGPLRQLAEARLSQRLVPMLEHTGGALVTEMLCEGCERVALLTDTHRVVRDGPSGYVELYDVRADPEEERDVFEEGSPAAAQALRRLAGYDRVRAGFGGS